MTTPFASTVATAVLLDSNVNVPLPVAPMSNVEPASTEAVSPFSIVIVGLILFTVTVTVSLPSRYLGDSAQLNVITTSPPLRPVTSPLVSTVTLSGF